MILLSFNNHDAILKLVFQNFASFSIAHILSIEKENYCPDAYFLDNCTLNIHVNTMNEDIRNKVYKIFFDDIDWFTYDDTIDKKVYISGGDGGGTSIKGAVVGGIVAGVPGAIIGSRKKTNPITTTYKEIDNRKCILRINNNGKKQILTMSAEVYDMLNQYIPI